MTKNATKKIPLVTERAPRPFIKWAGGKRQLLDILKPAAPEKFARYHEPFVGGGAFLFCQLPQKAVISDANPELINCYQIIRDEAEALINSLQAHKNEEKYFYAMRSALSSGLSSLQRASRFIYLNKTCFNGLYRENKSGQFNVPFGRYVRPKIIDEDNLRAISNYLLTAEIKIACEDFQVILDQVKAGDFVYFDPPYVPITKTAYFATYGKTHFTLRDQKKLADVFVELDSKGALLMLSNSNTPLVHDLYGKFNIQTVYATRLINSKGAKRGKAANEVLVKNY